MCGRARCTLNVQQVARACGIPPQNQIHTVQMDRFDPTYNASPGSYLPVLTLQRRTDVVPEAPTADVTPPSTKLQEELVPVIRSMKWGLVPSFTNKKEVPDHFRMFNARSESIGEKVSFRRLVLKNRCLFAAEGFYEWKKDGSKKQPYYIHFKDGRPLVFPALYDIWVNSEGKFLHTFTILTTSSSSSLQWLHDRMPVIFRDETSINEWLSDSSLKLDLLLKPYEASDLVWHPVTPSMGKVSFNGPECIKEIKLSADSKPISKFFVKKSDVKVPPHFNVQNPVQEQPTLIHSEDLKVPTFEGIKEPSCNMKPSEEVKKEANLPGIKEEEHSDGENEHFAFGRIKRETDIPEVKLFAATKQEFVGKREPQEDLNHDELQRDVEAHGVKRELDQMESKACQHAVFVATAGKVVKPAAKRGKCINTAGDKQSTLHSFFAKK